MISALLLVLAAAPVQWNDGQRAREAWLNPGAIAEVEPSAAGAEALLALDPKAVISMGGPRVTLWQLSHSNAVALLAALEEKLPGHFAPVLHDSPSPGAKLRVPAGGVLVWLHAASDAARFLASRGLVVKQDFGNGTLLVHSAPGSATLALSAALRGDKRVKSVMPNWWLRGVRR